MTRPVDLASIRGIEGLWARSQPGGNAAPMQHEDRVLVDLLGLGIGQVLDQLFQVRPGFTDFLDWIEATAGLPDPVRVERYHALRDGAPVPPAAQARIAALEAAAPVLDADDMAFWDEHGYVVVRQAITRGEADAAAQVLWQHIGASPDDPASWYAEPARGLWFPLCQAPQLDVARRSPRVQKAFAQIWGTGDLWGNVDRMSFNQPVRANAPFLGSPLHIDTSLAAPMPLGTQAILYLTDTPAQRGALQVLPGFHRDFDAWAASLGGADPRRVDLRDGVVPVPGDAGDMVIWHHALPHGATPNHDDFPRIVQYLNFAPPTVRDDRPWL